MSSPVELPVLVALDLGSDAVLGIVGVVLLERLAHEVHAKAGETAMAA